MAFTGQRDADLEVMKRMDDRTLLSYCMVNRYANNLCNNETFWQNRFVQKFGNTAAQYKPDDRSWKVHYLTVVSNLDELTSPDSNIGRNPFNFFGRFVGGYVGPNEDLYQINTEAVRGLAEIYRNAFWLLDLGVGDTIKLSFPIDRYEDLDEIVRVYKASDYTDKGYFSPSDIIRIIRDFYDETVTAEELELQQEADNPHAEGLTAQDANVGFIRRKDLLNMFLEGLDEHDGAYHLYFGS